MRSWALSVVKVAAVQRDHRPVVLLWAHVGVESHQPNRQIHQSFLMGLALSKPVSEHRPLLLLVLLHVQLTKEGLQASGCELAIECVRETGLLRTLPRIWVHHRLR